MVEVSYVNVHPVVACNLDIRDDVSIQDVLRVFASSFGIRWSVCFAERATSPEGAAVFTSPTVLQFNGDIWQCADVGMIVSPEKYDSGKLETYIAESAELDPAKRHAALGMLIQSSDKAAIRPLIDAATGEPVYGYYVVKTLSQFFDDERARAGILKIAQDGDVNGLEGGLLVYEEQKAVFPNEVIKSILSSRDDRKVYVMLSYLAEHGTAEQLSLVKPLTAHKNDEIRQLAEDITNRK